VIMTFGFISSQTATILFCTSALLTPSRAEFGSIAKKSAQLSPLLIDATSWSITNIIRTQTKHSLEKHS